MTKIVIIERCCDCPRNGHKGGFGSPAYVPVCRTMNRELPYTIVGSELRVIAIATEEIPDWCPLTDYENKSSGG